MAYTDESVKAKLSALNETQESVVTVAQWIMFHRRHAERTAQLWLQRLRDAPGPKRLNLIYLANEVIQQSKARKKDDFWIAFSPIIPEATATAYRGASGDLQAKIKRVVEVWRQRQVFEQPIQEAVEARLAELDKSRSSGKKALLGSGSILGGGPSQQVPPAIQPLIPLVQASDKVVDPAKPSSQAIADFDKLMDPDTALPTPPVLAARLSASLKQLAAAEGAVNEGLRAHRALAEALEKLLDEKKAQIGAFETTLADLRTRSSTAEAKKRDVEDSIMRGLSTESVSTPRDATSSGQTNGEHDTSVKFERPEMEALTPPSVEALTPVESPKHAVDYTPATVAAVPTLDQPGPIQYDVALGANHSSDLSASLIVPNKYTPPPGANGNVTKKRKLEQEFDQYGGGDPMGDLDEDVAELLRQEGGAH